MPWLPTLLTVALATAMASVSDAAAQAVAVEQRPPRLRSLAAPRYAVAASDATLQITWGEHTIAVRTTRTGGPHDWRRAITTLPSHVEVRDTVTNRADVVLGLRVRHALATSGETPFVAGRPEAETTDRYVPWNPTVFIPVGRDGVGLVVEDDVFRNQLYAEFVRERGEVALRTDMLCLAPGDRYTLVWSIYPSASESYWDFLNAVRADWDVNRTIPGSYIWFHPDEILAMPDDTLRAALERQRVGVASMWGGWVDRSRLERPPLIGFGTFVLADQFAGYRGRIRDAIAKLERARPSVKVLLYFDAQRDSSPDAAERYADSVLLTAGGRPETADWHARFSTAWSMVPTLTNGFGKAMLMVAQAMRGLGADGLYWDEMDGVDYRRPRLTTGTWDGRSCLLDDAGRVRQKVALVNLVSEDAKLAYAGEGFMLGNMPPTTRRFQNAPIVRMVEAQHNDVWGAFAHLATPLGYISGLRDWATVRAKIEEGLLIAGTRLDYGHDISARMFPFTPEFIEAGTLRGRERILTTRSGTHGWLDWDGPVRAFRYDLDGKEHVAGWHVKRRHGGVFVRVRLAADEVAVIERGE